MTSKNRLTRFRYRIVTALVLSLVFLLAGQAWSEKPYEDLLQSMQARQRQLDDLLMDTGHCLGEGLNGLLKIDASCSPDVRKLAEDENQDRQTLDQLMAKDLGLTPEQVGQERAKRNLEHYRQGILREVRVSDTETRWWNGLPPDPRKDRQPQPPPPQPSAANVILRLHGSNTIGAALAPELAKAFLKYKGYEAIDEKPIGPQERLIVGRKPEASGLDAIEIKSHGSFTAFDETAQTKRVGLKGGFCDIGMSSAAVTSLTYPDRTNSDGSKIRILDELRPSLGDLSSRASEHVIALDAVAIIVHPSNPLNSLSVEDLRSIFMGQYTSWSQVPNGRLEGSIELYTRDKQSGTYDTFRNTVLRGQHLDFDLPQIKHGPDGKPGFENSDELAAGVAANSYGIGFVSFAYTGLTKPVAIRKGDGREFLPSLFTIRSQDYPLCRKLYFYVPERPSPPASEFINFTLSRTEAQEIVRKVGFAPLIGDIPQDCSDKLRLFRDPQVPDAYKNLIRDAVRHAITLRFDTNSFELDTLGFRDVDRLLADPSISENTEVRLIGFADPRGPAEHNLKLSRDRADFVRNELMRRGVRFHIVTEGFGEERALLLDPDENTEESWRVNRRVEVWYKSNDCPVQ